MTKESDVTIILPNYNSELYIKKTLDSILNQTYQNWRLIIIDDNSNLNTKKILKKFKMNKKVKIFYLNSNRGAAYCRNYALKKIKTNYVAFIDSDDIWEKNKLKLQINFMKKNKYDFTYTCYETIGDQKKKIFPPNKLNYKQFLGNTSIATSTMILKYNIIKNAKFTDTKICEDYFLNVKYYKYKICLL